MSLDLKSIFQVSCGPPNFVISKAPNEFMKLKFVKAFLRQRSTGNGYYLISHELNCTFIQCPAIHDSGHRPHCLPRYLGYSGGCPPSGFLCSRDYDAFWLVLVHQHSSIFRRSLTTDWANVCIGLRTVWAYILHWFSPPYSADVW